MFWVSKKSLLAFISECFDKGTSGSADLPDDYFQDIMAKTKGNVAFSFMKLSQLQKIANGKKIIHPLAGEGVVVVGDKLGVSFPDGFKELSAENADFWSFPVAPVKNY